MSLLSNIEAGIKQLYGEKYNAAEDFPPEVKIMIGEIEKEFTVINHRISQLEARRPVPVATVPASAK